MPAATRPTPLRCDWLVSARQDPANHLAARALTGAALPSSRPTPSALTFRQRSTLNLFAGPCDPGNPCASKGTASGFLRSHGPTGGSVKAAGVYVRLTSRGAPFCRGRHASGLPGQIEESARSGSRDSGPEGSEEGAGLNDGGRGVQDGGPGVKDGGPGVNGKEPATDSRRPGVTDQTGPRVAASRWPAVRVAA
jgi:hypothetical protein